MLQGVALIAFPVNIHNENKQKKSYMYIYKCLQDISVSSPSNYIMACLLNSFFYSFEHFSFSGNYAHDESVPDGIPPSSIEAIPTPI